MHDPLRVMWLPVAQRELITASRRTINFWFRLAAPGLGLVFLVFASSNLANEPVARQGKAIFTFVSLALFFYSTLAGLALTSECISAERRDGTLPLLQITGMREIDLVLGKLLGNSVFGVSGFLAAIPLLALPLLLGGVTGFDIFRTTVILAGTLLLSLSVGVYASSRARSSTAALKHSLLATLVILVVGVFGLGYYGLKRKVLDQERWSANLERTGERAVLACIFVFVWALGLPTGSPAAMLLGVLGPFRRPFGSYGFWIESTLLFGMAIYFLVSARPFSEPVAEEIPQPADLPSIPRRRFRRSDPIAARFSHTPIEFMLALGLGIAGGFLQFISNIPLYSNLGPDLAILSRLAFATAVFLYFILARRAAEFLVEARRGGTLEVVLVTPLGWKGILALHRTAFLRLAWRPVALMMAGEIAGHLVALRFARAPDRLEFIPVFLVVTVLGYVCSLYATLWCGVFFGLRARSAAHAAVWTVLLVLIVPASAGLILPRQMPNLIPAAYFTTLLSTVLYIAADSLVWIACRLRLISLGTVGLIGEEARNPA